MELSDTFVEELGFSFVLIVASEFAVDWIKHAFIIKFNRIAPNIYEKFTNILAADIYRQSTGGGAACPHSAGERTAPVGSPVSGAQERSSPIAARMGFVPIPLLCLVVRVVGHDVWPTLNLKHSSGWLLAILIWTVLVMLKVLTGITLLGYACARTEARGKRGADFNKSTEFLQDIQRFTLHGKRIM